MVTENEDIQTNDSIINDELTEDDILTDTICNVSEHIDCLERASYNIVKAMMYLDNPHFVDKNDLKDMLEACEVFIDIVNDRGAFVPYEFKLLSYAVNKYGSRYTNILHRYNCALVVYEYLHYNLHWELKGTEYENLHI